MAAIEQPGNREALFHLIYSSQATIRLNQAGLVDLLKNARLRNEPRGLTGMLLYRDGLYLQFLEGKPDEVTGLLDRLRGDCRHKNITILGEGNLPRRLFPDWSMAYKNLAGLRNSLVPGYSECLQGHYENSGETDPTELLVGMFHNILIAA
jgi:hypothetical protein